MKVIAYFTITLTFLCVLRYISRATFIWLKQLSVVVNKVVKFFPSRIMTSRQK